MRNKYLVRNKKKYKGVFAQFTHTGNEVINLIKKKKLNNIEIISKLSTEVIELGSIHYSFYLSVESEDLNIVEFLIKDLKVDEPLTEDKCLKILNLKKFSGAYSEFVKNEYERYFLKYNIKDVEIRCINGFLD